MIEKYLKGTVSGGRAAQIEWMKNQNLLPVLKDKTKETKLTKADSLLIKKADSTKRIKDSLRINSATIKQSVATKPKELKTVTIDKPVTNK
ncbi:hypothetical protein D3C72_2051970 [compost metagenome]